MYYVMACSGLIFASCSSLCFPYLYNCICTIHIVRERVNSESNRVIYVLYLGNYLLGRGDIF
jgi:hypothetical protein